MLPIAGCQPEAAEDDESPESSALDGQSDLEVENPAAQIAGAPGASALFPAPGATNVCPDPPLRIKFAGTPRLGRGRLQVFRADQPTRAVASVDVAATNVRETRGSLQLVLPRSVYVDGDTVVAYLPYKALDYGQTYYVTVDAGAIQAPSGSFGVNGAQTWRFTTARAPTNLGQLTVGYDGASDFCSLQRALDVAPARSTITIKRGTYHGIVNVTGKSDVTITGEDRANTRLVGVNNDKLNAGTAKRALISFDRSSGITIEKLSIHNQTPQGGSQAEALRLQRCERCVVRDANIRSLQDTLLWDGKVYAERIYVEGNVDYIWGYGGVYFKDSEFKTVVRNGYILQARNGPGQPGYVFVDSKLTSDPGISGVALARIDVGQFPGSQVAFINCAMGSHISREGWVVTGSGSRAQLRFQEYQSTDLSGRPLSTVGRLAGSRQLSAAEAARLRNPATTLGGWTPPSR